MRACAFLRVTASQRCFPDHAKFRELPPATYASIFGGDEDEREELVPPEEVMRRLRSQGLLAAALPEEEKEGEGLLFIPQVCSGGGAA